MTNEQSRNETSYNINEVVKKIGNDFNKLNNKFINLLEENQRIKQENKILLKENQEILNNNLKLKEKFQEKDKQYEKLLQHVSDLENQKNEGMKQLEIISQNLINNLEILELDEINEDDIKILKEKNNSNFNKICDKQDFDIPSSIVDNKYYYNNQFVQVIETSFVKQPERKLNLTEIQVWYNQINESSQAHEAAKKI
jgi:hypothetical protein